MKAWPMFCKHCGQRIGHTELFCVRCGHTISQEEFESDASHTEIPKTASSTAGSFAPGPSLFDLAPETGNAVKALEPAQLPAPAEQVLPSPARSQPRYVPVRKNSFPIIELLVAILLVGGAVAAIWIFHSTIKKQDRLLSANIVVAITPASAKLHAGKSAEFAAVVSGSDDNEVNWSIEEGDAGGHVTPHGAKAEAGSISSLATYMAPKKPGIYHLRASSKANPDKSATAAITVRK